MGEVIEQFVAYIFKFRLGGGNLKDHKEILKLQFSDIQTVHPPLTRRRINLDITLRRMNVRFRTSGDYQRSG